MKPAEAKAHGKKAAVKTAKVAEPEVADEPEVSDLVLRQRKRNPTILHEIIGNNIKRYRTKRGMSQELLGEHLNVSFQQVQKYEKGVNRVDCARLLQISEILHVDINELYGTRSRRAKEPTAEDRYMATAEGQRLLHAMAAVPDRLLRRRIITLVMGIAFGTDGNPEDDDESSE